MMGLKGWQKTMCQNNNPASPLNSWGLQCFKKVRGFLMYTSQQIKDNTQNFYKTWELLSDKKR